MLKVKLIKTWTRDLQIRKIRCLKKTKLIRKSTRERFQALTDS